MLAHEGITLCPQSIAITNALFKKKRRKKANQNDSYKMKIPMDKKRQNYKPVILPGSELGNDTFGVLTPIG